MDAAIDSVRTSGAFAMSVSATNAPPAPTANEGEVTIATLPLNRPTGKPETRAFFSSLLIAPGAAQ